MRNTHRRSLRALAVGTAVAALAAPTTQASTADRASTDLETRCVGIGGPITVPTTLVVPAGQTCVLQGTQVEGAVDVRSGASLIVEEGAVLEQGVTVRADGYLEAVDATILGTTQLRGAYGALAESSTMGAADARNSGFLLVAESGLDGLFARGGEVFLEGTAVRGDVDMRNGAGIDIDDSTVEGALTVIRSDRGAVLCTSEVDGPARISNSGRLVQVGGDSPYGDCGTNVLGSDLLLTGNTAPEGTWVTDAIIRGDLTCRNNAPAPVGTNNRVRGAISGQCTDLESTLDVRLQQQRGPVRIGDEMRDRAVERSAQARAHAAAEGAATLN